MVAMAAEVALEAHCLHSQTVEGATHSFVKRISKSFEILVIIKIILSVTTMTLGNLWISNIAKN